VFQSLDLCLYYSCRLSLLAWRDVVLRASEESRTGVVEGMDEMVSLETLPLHMSCRSTGSYYNQRTIVRGR
jgi:hypothetical protein